MATRTTTAAGVWSAGSTWIGGVAPTIGDTAVLNHNVTLDVNADIGTSGASATVALTVNNGVTFSFNSGRNLILRGGISQKGNSVISIASGCLVEFDASNNAAPSSIHYAWIIGDTHNASPLVFIRGTTNSRAIIRSAAGSGNAYTLGGKEVPSGDQVLKGGLFDAEYCDFTRIGDSSIAGFNPNATGDSYLRFQYCNFYECGEMVNAYNIGDNGTFLILDCSWNGSDLGAPAYNITINNYYDSAGANRQVKRNVFDFTARFSSPNGFAIEKNVFLRSIETSYGTADWASFYRNVVIMPGSDYECSIAGSTVENFWFFDDPTEYNPHFINALTWGRGQTMTGDIFDCSCNVDSPAQEGDCISLYASGGTPATLNLNRIIVVKGPAGKTVGTLISALGNSNSYISAEHCTVHTGTQGLAVGESYSGHAGMVVTPGIKSNIFWSSTPGQGYKVYDSGANDSVTDLATSAQLDNNAGYNLATGSNGKGYHNLEFSSGSPGASDVSGNPLFINEDANFRSWGISIGGSGTVADTIAKLALRNFPSWNPNHNIDNLLAYITESFRPQNEQYRAAAHDGSQIGAVAMGAPITGTSYAGLYRGLLGCG